ncbi:Glyoxylase [Trachipleistophora hominis]|uniref:Glyoxylase n=1 Tax=Trachipleistophora hominis TaxID=72359 RepID=L7JSQ8_TRAHO|nr:Glyoxylase [Trachipleistophora hominis]
MVEFMERKHKLLGVCSGISRSMMYLVYNDEYAIVFDITDINTLGRALEIDPPARFMDMMEVFNCERVFKRKLLAVFYTRNCRNYDLIRFSYEFLTKSIFFEWNLNEKTYCFEDFEVAALTIPNRDKNAFCFLIDDYFIIGNAFFYLGCRKFYKEGTINLSITLEKLRHYVRTNVICCYGHDFSKMGYKLASKYFDPSFKVQNSKISHLW